MELPVKAYRLATTAFASLFLASCASTSQPSTSIDDNVGTQVGVNEDDSIVGTPLPGGGFAS